MPNAQGHSCWTHGLPWLWLWWVLAEKWEDQEEEGRGGGITPQKERCRHWGKHLGWEAADWVWHSSCGIRQSQIAKKKCLSQHAPNTMNFDGHDLEWEFKALLKCITSTVQCCVDLDLVFHWVHYLPKSDLCWMHSIFLTAVKFSLEDKIAVNVRAAQKSLL